MKWRQTLESFLAVANDLLKTWLHFKRLAYLRFSQMGQFKSPDLRGFNLNRNRKSNE